MPTMSNGPAFINAASMFAGPPGNLKSFIEPVQALPPPFIKPAKSHPVHEFCIKLSMSSVGGRPLSVSLARYDEKDHPLIGCSLGFLAISGLARSEVLGRNCRFLNTGLRMPLRKRLRNCIEHGLPFMGVLENVRYLGNNQYETFQNLLHLAVIVAGSRSYIVGLQADVTGLDLDLADASNDAARLQSMFDNVLSSRIDSWIHLQEGMYHAAPLYIHIRQGWRGDDEIYIEEEIERINVPSIRAAPDHCLVLAPRLPPRGTEDHLNWRFVNPKDFSEPILAAPAQGPCKPPVRGAPGLSLISLTKAVEAEPRLLSLAHALPLYEGSEDGSSGSFDVNSSGSLDASSGADTKASAGYQDLKGTETKESPPGSADSTWTSTMANQLKALKLEDPACVLSARGISKLGMASAATLRTHFSRYGQVKAVRIPFVHKKRSKEPRSSGRGFIVMELPEFATQILTDGNEHLVDGVKVSLERFIANVSEDQKGV